MKSGACSKPRRLRARRWTAQEPSFRERLPDDPVSHELRRHDRRNNRSLAFPAAVETGVVAAVWVAYAFAAVFGLVSILTSLNGLRKDSGEGLDASSVLGAIFIALINSRAGERGCRHRYRDQPEALARSLFCGRFPVIARLPLGKSPVHLEVP